MRQPIFFCFLSFLWFALSASGAVPALVQSPAGCGDTANTATPIACTFGGNITAGNQIIVGAACSVTAQTLTISDSAGNAYTQKATLTAGTNVVYQWQALAATTTALTVTVSKSGQCQGGVVMAEYSGVALPAYSTDVTNASSAHAGSTFECSTSPYMTTTNPNDLIVSTLNSSTSPASPAALGSFTMHATYAGSNQPRTGLMGLVVATTQTGLRPQYTGSAGYNQACVSVAYKDSSAYPATGRVPRRVIQ